MISTIRNALRMASTELDIISNNVANAGSTGFKRSDGNFLHFYNENTPMKGMNVGFGVVHEEPRRSDSKQGASSRPTPWTWRYGRRHVYDHWRRRGTRHLYA